MLEKNREMVVSSLTGLKELALGGAAVGTGLNTPKGFDTAATAAVSELAGIDFKTADNKFHSLTSKDATVFTHGTLKALAANMTKVANDARWLSSGPRCGPREIQIPENELGGSVMPGKVNPTQCEPVTVVVVQVMGNDCAIGFAASQGNFKLDVFMPVVIYNFLQPVRLLSDSPRSFELHCARGIKADRRKVNENLNRSLMLVTALTLYIGYDHAAQTAKKAYKEDIFLEEAYISLGFLTGEEFNGVSHPEQMVSSQ